jgi:hypothetical protein
MAGTIVITTLSDGTNSTSATNPIMGSAKAWVNFNGTTATPSTIRASYNVTSVTKNGTGDYTLNFTNAFVDASYAVVFGFASSYGVTTQVTAANSGSAPTTQTTTAVRITHRDAIGGSANDVANQYVAVFR